MNKTFSFAIAASLRKMDGFQDKNSIQPPSRGDDKKLNKLSNMELKFPASSFASWRLGGQI
jgi:hypothetical protein